MSRYLPIVLMALIPAWSCADRSLADVKLVPVSEERIIFDVSENRDVDILFVVDNSKSMEREQNSLREKFGNLIDVLQQHPDGLPSIHIGVISTDLGTGVGGACSEQGDGGAFLGSQCAGLNGSFIESLVNEDGTRTENFSLDMAETFSCMADLGIRGCGFEQPLESMRRALSLPQADDFIREHAYLAVIIVTDEDDCSAHDNAIFAPTPQDLSTALGPPKSFRCFEFGVECDSPDARATGLRADCTPMVNSPYLHEIDDYIDFLYSKKRFPEQILTATIAGKPGPINVVSTFDSDNGYDYLALDFSCTAQDAEAVPPIRLNAFLDGFGDNSQRTSICQSDLTPALEKIAKKIINKSIGCFTQALRDTDAAIDGVQPDCVISEQRPDEEERRLPECSDQNNPEMSETLPCFTLLPEALCAGHPTSLAPKVFYTEGEFVPPGTQAFARCSF